jgi:hypothetical protein
MVPGGRPQEALRTALGITAGRLLLAIDQFEELFTLGEEAERRRFLHELTAAVGDPDGRVTVVLAIRADYYDRPLLDAEFAPCSVAGW